MAITDMPERFTLGEVEVAHEVRRVSTFHKAKMLDEMSSVIHGGDRSGGVGHRLEIGQLRWIVTHGGTKSLRMKGPIPDQPDFDDKWKTISMTGGAYANFPTYEDDEYAERIDDELLRRIVARNKHLAKDPNFGDFFRGFLPEEEQEEEDPTPSPENEPEQRREGGSSSEPYSTSESGQTLETLT